MEEICIGDQVEAYIRLDEAPPGGKALIHGQVIETRYDFYLIRGSDRMFHWIPREDILDKVLQSQCPRCGVHYDGAELACRKCLREFDKWLNAE